MKKIIKPFYLIYGLSLSLTIATAQTKPTIKEVPAKMTRSLDGKELFRQFCAVCHGVDAKGGGPAAAALKRAPSDLTQISRKHEGKFPSLPVKVAITGGDNIVTVLSTGLSTGVAGAAGTMTVTPATGLIDGQSVHVVASGLAANAGAYMEQCVTGHGIEGCDQSSTTFDHGPWQFAGGVSVPVKGWP